MSKTLYVGRVSYDANEDDIRAAFAVKDEEGNVTNIASVRLIDKTGDDGIRRKFAFVEMNTDEQAQAGLAMDGQEILGRPVQVRIAEDRGPRAPRAGGFQGGNNRGFSGGYNGGGRSNGYTPRDGGRRSGNSW